MIKISRALISCWDKTDLIPFAQALSDRGVEIISSGGTAAHLAEAGIPVVKVEDVTGYPEVLGGRVKTLHPMIHAPILAARSPEHQADLDKLGASPIELVVVNLYPFVEEAIRQQPPLDKAIEYIDIGGPTLLRGAAKNYQHTVALHNPDQYEALLGVLAENDGQVPESFSQDCARRLFFYTSWYDAQIQAYFGKDDQDAAPYRTLHFEKLQDLRYGENPHQKAAAYRPAFEKPGGLASAIQLWGKELSFNNFVDVQAANELVLEFQETAVAIIKHTNPCGLAVRAESLSEAFEAALRGDSVSAFGGIVACNRIVDLATAEKMKPIFFECIIAPGFEAEALELLKSKKNLRLLAADSGSFPGRGTELKSLTGGMLFQDVDPRIGDVRDSWEVVSQRKPSPAELRELAFAWVAAKHVKSNAIVFSNDMELYGAGAGQMSRVDAVRLARMKAEQGKRTLKGLAMASDAFFPFRDGVDVAHEAGVTAIVQPGGSVRDDEVIAAADEHGMCMVMTGKRHFKH